MVAETGEGALVPEGEGKVGGKNKLLLLIVVVILLLGGVGAGLYFSGMLDGLLGKGEAAGEEAQAAQPQKPGVFYNMEEMLVNLSSNPGRTRYLKINISLELESEAAADAVRQVEPRIKDQFTAYLRELRVEELSGSAGLYRLREELLARVSTAIYPQRVRDVLFQEVLVQ